MIQMLKSKCEVQIGRVTTNQLTPEGAPVQYIRLRVQLDGGGIMDVEMSLVEYALAISGMSVRSEATLHGLEWLKK